MGGEGAEDGWPEEFGKMDRVRSVGVGRERGRTSHQYGF